MNETPEQRHQRLAEERECLLQSMREEVRKFNEIIKARPEDPKQHANPTDRGTGEPAEDDGALAAGCAVAAAVAFFALPPLVAWLLTR